MLPLSRCAACGEAAFPPTDQCMRCGARSLAAVSSEGRGRVVASTWVPTPFAIRGFGADGYGVAWVDLDDGPRVQVLLAGAALGPDTPGIVDVVVLEGVEIPTFSRDAP